MRKQRRIINGYTSMGKPRVPPLPQFIIMQDRSTADFYVLTHTGVAPALTLEPSLALPTKPDKVYYGPYDGPYLNGNVRLYLSGGVLSAEFAQGPGLNYQQRVVSRRGNERDFVEITAPAEWQEGDPLTYTVISV